MVDKFQTLVKYLEDSAFKLGFDSFDYEDGAVFATNNGRFKTVEQMFSFMETELEEKEAEEDRLATDAYYASEQYKIDLAMEK